MPELPEVETIVQGLKPLLTGRIIVQVKVLDLISTPQGAAIFISRLIGTRIQDVRRRAKLLLLDLYGIRGPLVLAVHLRMTGGLFVDLDSDEMRKFCRVHFELADKGFFMFTDIRRLGMCMALFSYELASWSFFDSLGPEPLEIDARDFVRCFQGRNRTIKAALLDQKILAGVGNIYADESLFRAGIRPQAKIVSLSHQRLQGLHKHLQEILRQAIAEKGSSIRDYRDAVGNMGTFQKNFKIYGRAGEACVVCDTKLCGIKVAGRSTLFCPNCQR